MNIPSLLRIEENRALSSIVMNGSILDIGGDRNSEYVRLIGGEHEITTINLDLKSKPDIIHDLETPLPVEDSAFDYALLINVLEHIYGYKPLLEETTRILKPSGKLVIVVPFMFPVHPSPYDFRRFTSMALERELETLGYADIYVKPLGHGVFSACYLAVDRLMPWPVRLAGFWTARYAALGLDAAFSALSRLLGKKYDPSDYALGYFVTAVKIGHESED